MSFNEHRKTCSCTHHNGSTGTYCFHRTGFSLSPGVLEQRLSARVENGPTKVRLSRRARVVRPVSECDWLSSINRQCYIDVAKDSSYRQSQDSNCTDCILRSYVQGFSGDIKMESWAIRGSSECLPGQTQHLLPPNMHNKISLVSYSAPTSDSIGLFRSLQCYRDLSSSTILSQATLKLPPNLKNA